MWRARGDQRSGPPDCRAPRKALAPLSADRFLAAAEFARALAAPATTPAASTAVSTPIAGPASAWLGPPACRRVPVAAVALGLGFVVALGVLFGWLRSHRSSEDGGTGLKRLAVLPSRTWADRRTSTSPMASPTRCGASSPHSRVLEPIVILLLFGFKIETAGSWGTRSTHYFTCPNGQAR